MKPNIGKIDRMLRCLTGLALVALTATGTIGVWGWLGLIPLLTGLLGWCPPYHFLGLNTCTQKCKD